VYFHVKPLMVGAFPGSAVQACDLLLSQEGRQPVWFDVDLLDMVRLQRSSNPRIATDSFVHTLYQKQNLRGHQTFFSEESTRKQLGKAVDEYENVLFMVEKGVREVGEGDSLMACCPSCVGTTGRNCFHPYNLHFSEAVLRL
jgi:hypothetical protein